MEATDGKTPPIGGRAQRADEAAAAFRARYVDFQYRFGEFVIDHLCDVGRAFKGDLGAMLVLALVGQSWLAAARAAAEAGVPVETVRPERLSTSASRIADFTGISRQTVRRKLALLEEWGWILRNADGSVRLASIDGKTPAKRDLADVDRRALRRVARLFADLDAIVEAHAPPPVGSATGAAPDRAQGAQNEHLPSSDG